MADEKIPFDYLGAKKAGYSDSEIQSYLKQNYSFEFDITGAKNSGYNDNEIADYITKYEAPSKKKVGGTSSEESFPTDFTGVLSTSLQGRKPKDEKAKFIKPLPVPISIDEGVRQDKKANSGWAGVYNMLVGSVARAAGGVSEFMNTQEEAFLDRYDKENGIPVGTSNAVRKRMNEAHPELKAMTGGLPERNAVVNFIEKARSSKSSRANEELRSQFDITDGVSKDDVKAMLFQAPSTLLDMGLGYATGGGSFIAQNINDLAKELDETGMADKVTPNEKLGYFAIQGTVQGAIDQLSLGAILKSTGLTKKLKQKITNEIIDEFTKKGIKATTEQIEKAALRKASSFANQVKRVGIKSATAWGTESFTEGSQTAEAELGKIALNKITKKDIFDEEDIKTNLIKNVINASAQGGVVGLGLGGAHATLSSTQKALRNQISQVTTPEDFQKIQQDIAQQVELGNITEQEAEAANITAQQYAEIAATIPNEIDAEKKYALIGGIEQREQLKKTIEETQQEIGLLDEAFHEEPKARIELLNAKLEQTNDYIDGLVAGKKVTYKKEGEEYFKTTPEGEVKPISKEHYELGVAIREEDAAKNKKPTISPEDQKTFTFTADEDVPPQLEKTQPIHIGETSDGKIEATYSGEQLIKAGLATKEVTPLDEAKETLKKAVEKGKLTGMYAEMAVTNPEEVLKDVAKQAQNLNDQFQPHNDGRDDASREAAEDTFGNSVVEAAIKLYPATQKEQAQEGAVQGVVPSLENDVLNLNNGEDVSISLSSKTKEGDYFEVTIKDKDGGEVGTASFILNKESGKYTPMAVEIKNDKYKGTNLLQKTFSFLKEKGAEIEGNKVKVSEAALARKAKAEGVVPSGLEEDVNLGVGTKGTIRLPAPYDSGKDFAELPRVLIRFGDAPKDENGNVIASSAYAGGKKGGQQEGVSVFEAGYDPRTGHIVINSGNEALSLSLQEAILQKRKIFLVGGKEMKARGEDFELQIDPKTYKVEKEISADEVVEDASTGDMETSVSGKNLGDKFPKYWTYEDAQQKTSPIQGEKLTKESTKLPDNWKQIKDTEVDVPSLDPKTGEATKERMTAKEAYVKLSKQIKQLDNVLNCI